jgi:hypothetical protein
MTSTGWIWDFFAWLSLPLLALLAGVMAWRKLNRLFPFFFFYVVMICLIGVIRFIAYKGFSVAVYFYVFWGSDSVVLLLSFSALYEIFLKRIFPGFHKIRFYRYLFPAVGVLIAILAFVTALHSPDKRTSFLIMSRIFDFLRSAVIGFFVLLILVMGRLFDGYEFSIAAGFGIQAAVALANAAVRTLKGYKPIDLDRFEPIAFDVACLIWLWSFSKAKKSPPGSGFHNVDPATLHEAKKWEQSLKEFITPKH